VSLEGRVAVVTGGGRGIGRATALELAAAGAVVAVLARTVVEIEGTADLITARGGEAFPIPADVGDDASVAAAFALVRRECGPIGILVNNAGIGGGHQPVADLDASVWRRIVEVDLTGPFLCARAAWSDMAEARWGRIVNVSSSAAVNGLPRFGPVAVAKAGLDHLTRIMAAEGKSAGIAVAALYPGLVDTRLQEEARAGGVAENGPTLQAMFDRYKTRGLLVPPETPAAMIAFLCSDDGARLSGRVLTSEDVAAAMGDPS